MKNLKGDISMEIKNLSQLKRVLREGHDFIIVKHFIKPEYTGQIRKVNIMQTNGMYSIDSVNFKNPINNANGGRGTWLEFGKAKDWKFENGLCEYGETYNGEYQPVWQIKVI
jgi:hypothetical protein